MKLLSIFHPEGGQKQHPTYLNSTLGSAYLRLSLSISPSPPSLLPKDGTLKCTTCSTNKCNPSDAKGVADAQGQQLSLSGPPSTGWMLYYLCFTPSTVMGPPLRKGGRLGGPISHRRAGRSSQSPRSQEWPEYGWRTYMDQNKWTSSGNMVHFGLANAKIQYGIRAFFTKMVVWAIWTIFGPVHFPTVNRLGGSTTR